MSAVLEAQEPTARYLEAAQPALVRQFDLLGSAPGGISSLRELILTLAVQGKLAPQLPGDEPPSLLLRQIESAKERLIAAGAMKRPKLKDEIAEDELPFPTPPGWQWVRLGTLLQKIGAGSTPLGGKEVYVPSGVKFLRSQNVWNDGLRLDGVAYISLATHAKMSGTVVTANDLLFNITGASIGRCAAVPADFDEANVSQHVTIIRPVLPALNPFLHTVLISRLVQQAVMDVQVGVSREGLSIAKLGNFLVPIPPLQEQARIVARVADLMRLCDALEAKGRLEAEQHARLLGTLLGTLTDSSTPEELAANWQRVADHFDLLLDRPEAVDALEQTILQLAVRGLLVTKVPSDEPARLLLERICAQKQRKQTKSPIGLAELAPGVAPYELPSHWEWAQLGDLVENMGSGWSPACEEGERTDPARWAVLRTTAVQVMEYRAHEHKAIPLKFAPRPEIEVQPGDILVTRAGPMNRVGISCWVDQTPARLMLSDKIVRFHPVSDDLSPAFVVLALNAGWTRELLEAAKTGMAASQVNVSQSDLKSLWVPICSTEEQTRIVTRVTELRRLCTNLRERLAASQTTQSHLAEALVGEV